MLIKNSKRVILIEKLHQKIAYENAFYYFFAITSQIKYLTLYQVLHLSIAFLDAVNFS